MTSAFAAEPAAFDTSAAPAPSEPHLQLAPAPAASPVIERAGDPLWLGPDAIPTTSPALGCAARLQMLSLPADWAEVTLYAAADGGLTLERLAPALGSSTSSAGCLKVEITPTGGVVVAGESATIRHGLIALGIHD